MSFERDVIEITEEDGVTIYVTPLTPFMIQSINQRALALFPDPDPEPYEKPLPDSLIDGEVIPADADPEYTRLKTEARMKRNAYMQAAILSMTQIKGISREVLVESYREMLAPLRQYANGLPEDDYVAVLRSFVLKPATYLNILIAAQKKMPLSQEEIRDGMRIFRPVIQRSPAAGSDSAQDTPDIPEGEQVSTQQSAG